MCMCSQREQDSVGVHLCHEQAGLCDAAETEQEPKLPAWVASGIPQDGDYGSGKTGPGDSLCSCFLVLVPLG